MERVIDPERVRLAYHEAGHAAMVLILGGALHKVTIVPSAKFSGETDATMGAPSAAILVALGGDACERIHFGRPATGATGDHEFARSKGLAEEDVGKAIAIAESLLRFYWTGVVALADELIKTEMLDGANAREVFSR